MLSDKEEKEIHPCPEGCAARTPNKDYIGSSVSTALISHAWGPQSPAAMDKAGCGGLT